MKKCNTCGSEFEDDVKFCPNCGSELAEKTEQEVKQEVKQEVEKVEEVKEEKKFDFSKGKAITITIFALLNGLCFLTFFSPLSIVGVVGTIVIGFAAIPIGIGALVSAIKSKKVGLIIWVLLAFLIDLASWAYGLVFLIDLIF